MKGAEIFIPKLYSYRVVDLIRAISQNAKIKKIGIRPGEKIHEELISESDSIYTKEFNDYFIIYSSAFVNILNKRPFSYNSKSNENFLTISQLRKLLKTK